jgi:hypothetical protein
MKNKIYEVHQGDTIYRIEEDYPEVGSYLYIIINDQCIKDYLQDNTEICKHIALIEYGISKDSWCLLNE